jgi:hypothetical protein
MGGVIIGSEALSKQLVTRNELRHHYQRLFPDVYVRGEPTLRDRTVGAWLWSGRRAVIAGVAASALHGAAYVDPDVPIELVWNNTRPPAGLVVRNETLSDDEIKRVVGMPVTTPARVPCSTSAAITHATRQSHVLMRWRGLGASPSTTSRRSSRVTRAFGGSEP